jgi:hypothetical protein
MDFSVVDRMIITGGFGQYLNIEKAVTIGLVSSSHESAGLSQCDSGAVIDAAKRPLAVFVPHRECGDENSRLVSLSKQEISFIFK